MHSTFVVYIYITCMCVYIYACMHALHTQQRLSENTGVQVWDLRKVAKMGANAVPAKHFEGSASMDARFDFRYCPRNL